MRFSSPGPKRNAEPHYRVLIARGDIPCSTALSALEGTARRPGPERRTSGAEQNGGRCRGIAGAVSDSVAAERRRLGRGFRRRDSAEGAPEPSVRKTSFFLPEGTTAGKAGRVQPEGCGAERTPFCGRGVSVGSCRHEVDSGCLCGPVPHECGAWFRAAFSGAVSRPEAGATWGGWPFRAGRGGSRCRAVETKRRVQGLRSAFRPAGRFRGAGEGRKSAARAFPQGLGRWFRRVREASALP